MTKQEKALANLGLTAEEIADILKTDKEIDRGAKLFDLDPEREKGAKKARQADRKQTTPTKREKKVDNEKKSIIQTLIDVLSHNSGCAHLADDDSVIIINPEREFTFTVNGKKYKITLACPRS